MNTSHVGMGPVPGTVGKLAVDLLSYGSMGEEEMVGVLLSEANPYDLGLVIQAWYQMALNHRGKEVTEKAARATAQLFQKMMEDERSSQIEKVAASFARSLMLDLVAGLDDRYAELWAAMCSDHAETLSQVGAYFLGWAIGMMPFQPEAGSPDE